VTFVLRLVVASSIFAHLLCAQVSEADLRRSYRVTGDGAFVLGAGVEMKAVFDRHGEACTLTSRGQLTENQVFKLFDVLVPVKTRGLKKQGIIQCTGGCERSEVYQNVELVTGAVGKQTSDPAAIITFGRSECKAAIAEAGKTVLNIQRNEGLEPARK
jgi:hypothetical protein